MSKIVEKLHIDFLWRRIKFSRSLSLNNNKFKFSRSLSSNVAESQSLPEYQNKQTDSSYFKSIGKTINTHWIRNAEDVFSRMEWNLLIDPKFDLSTQENLKRRLADDKINLREIRKLWDDIQNLTSKSQSTNQNQRRKLIEQLVSAALWAPNQTHPASMAINLPQPILIHGEQIKQKKVIEFQKYCEKRNLLKNDNLGNLAFHRAYYLKGPLAELEEALVRYALNSMKFSGFQLMSVPDILYSHVIESCGMRTRGERDQVFWLDSNEDEAAEICLSGTSEMSLGGSLSNRIFSLDELPLKLGAVSRCHRAETSSIDVEKGLYRVHDFTKVELFGVTANETGEESSQLHEEFRSLEEKQFSELGLHFKTLEMPPDELGVPAYRKYDIEAWMPGRGIYGEISSTSNCTDFQSRRLNIRYRNKKGEVKYAHTVNGTAVAVPRMLIALVENSQMEDGNLKLPKVLFKFMNRSWDEAMKSHKQFKSTFLKNKPAMLKYTKKFRNMELF